jgi:hypothetical protein
LATRIGPLELGKWELIRTQTVNGLDYYRENKFSKSVWTCDDGNWVFVTITLWGWISWSEIYWYFVVSSVHRPTLTGVLEGLWRNQGRNVKTLSGAKTECFPASTGYLPWVKGLGVKLTIYCLSLPKLWISAAIRHLQESSG